MGELGAAIAHPLTEEPARASKSFTALLLYCAMCRLVQSNHHNPLLADRLGARQRTGTDV